MWFKKKSVLQAEGHYDTEKSADGTTDFRTTQEGYGNYSSSINNSGLPSAADAGNYFYLPALGCYRTGLLNEVGSNGYYWSSSADPEGISSAYSLFFFGGFGGFGSYVGVFSSGYRNSGYRVDGFE